MKANERVVENLNRSLHALFADDPDVFLLGEDIADPYGGAFKVSKGLSTSYPDRVLSTPISEGAIVGLAGGLALAGHKPIAEMMFGDFITLGFDQILNFATKSVSMYGKPVPMNLVVRCPVGGNRSYGPTHSQNLQKHFVGIPHLSLYEVSPFHDNRPLFDKLVNLNAPSILFEDKVLYTQPVYRDGVVDDLFVFDFLGADGEFARVVPDGMDDHTCLIIAPGGLTARCLAAAKNLLIDYEIGAQIVVPSRLYPFDIGPIAELAASCDHLFIVEDGGAGGTWGCEVARVLYDALWGKLKHKIQLISSRDSIIPCAGHLENQVIVQAEDIYRAVTAEVCNV
jgi:pyruvate/2-oxoglutarate/acetoin dehydrogenase E1 component